MENNNLNENVNTEVQEAEVPAVEKKKLSLPVIVGAAVGGVLLVVGIILAVILLGGGENEEVCPGHVDKDDDLKCDKCSADYDDGEEEPEITKEKCTFGATATLHCGFDGEGCPEIILVPETEACDDGAVRYGDCFEIVLWKNGVNVWRHYRDEQYHWQLRMSLTFPVAEGSVHELSVQVLENQLTITLNGQKMILRTEDIPEQFYLGATVCEGIARLYDFKLENNPEKSCTAGFFNV